MQHQETNPSKLPGIKLEELCIHSGKKIVELCHNVYFDK